MTEIEVQKRIKALRKKLAQIEKLKEKSQLTPEEAEKVGSEKLVFKEVQALERGVPLEEARAEAEPTPARKVPQPAAEPAAPPALPAEVPTIEEAALAQVPEQEDHEPEPIQITDPIEAEKKIKNLKKKLAQIARLKEKDRLTEEETAKVAAESAISAEVLELEIGLLEPDQRSTAKALQKKLKDIQKLKSKPGQLTAPEREKVAKAAGFQRELDALLARRPVIQLPRKAPEEPPRQVQVAAAARPPPTTGGRSKRRVVEEVVEDDAWGNADETDDFVVVTQDSDVAVEKWGDDLPEDTHDSDEGFVTKASKTAKLQAKRQAAAAAAAEAAAREAEAAAAAEEERLKAEAAAAAAAAEALERRRAEAHTALPARAPWHSVVDDDDSGELEEWQRDITPLQSPQLPPCSPPVEPEPLVAEPAYQESPQRHRGDRPAANAGKAPALASRTAVLPPACVDEKGDTTDAGTSVEKRVKNLRKKLAQIERLKSRGGQYTDEETKKIDAEGQIEAEIRALERGEPWPPASAAPPASVSATSVASAPPASVSAASVASAPGTPPREEVSQAVPPQQDEEELSVEEVKKRVRTIRKKLTQIEKLRERGGHYNTEEKEKLASEKRLLEQVVALEAKL